MQKKLGKALNAAQEIQLCNTTAINAIKLLEKEIISMNLKEYIKIKTVEDSFPVGYEKYLVNKVLNKDYKTRPVEALAIVLNIATVYSIYEAVMFWKQKIGFAADCKKPYIKK